MKEKLNEITFTVFRGKLNYGYDSQCFYFCVRETFIRNGSSVEEDLNVFRRFNFGE